MTKKLNKNDFIFVPCIIFVQPIEEGAPKKEVYSQATIKVSEIYAIYKDSRGYTIVLIPDSYFIVPIMYEDFLIDNFLDHE